MCSQSFLADMREHCTHGPGRSDGLNQTRPLAAGVPNAATASPSCCREAARSAPIRPVSIRRCTRPTGYLAFSIGPSTRPSSSAALPPTASPYLLGAHHRAQSVELHPRRRRLSACAQRHQFLAHDVYGQPSFFSPRAPSPWLSPAGTKTATSYYDSAPLHETLEELLDFDPDQRVHHAFFGRRDQCAL
jgi:hypothetical protein